jgi:cytoskeletal protein RodZ
VTPAAERDSGDFGGMLKAAREKRGVSLRQISTATKISVAALEALERNDVSRLPGGIFSRSFVRSYALQVGLDPDQTIERFVARFPEVAVTAAHAAAEQQLEEEEHDSNQQSAATFVRLIVISVPIVGALLYLGTMVRQGADTPTVAEPVQGAVVTSEPPPSAAPTNAPPPSAPAAVSPAPVASAGSSPAQEPTRPPPATPAAGRVAAPASAPPGSAAPAAPPDPADRVTVAVVATAPCWVSAIVDGERVVSREFQTGERMAFEVGRSVVLTAGDAAALAVTINGEEARRLGSAGQVVTVRVTPTNFKEYLAAP